MIVACVSERVLFKNVPLFVNLNSITFQLGWKTFQKIGKVARKEPRRNPKLLGSVFSYNNKTLNNMAKIQITTAPLRLETQVLVPNCYFISKAVKAMLAIDQLRDYFKMMEADGHPIDNFITTQVTTSSDFLHELIHAFEGEESK